MIVQDSPSNIVVVFYMKNEFVKVSTIYKHEFDRLILRVAKEKLLLNEFENRMQPVIHYYDAYINDHTNTEYRHRAIISDKVMRIYKKAGKHIFLEHPILSSNESTVLKRFLYLRKDLVFLLKQITSNESNRLVVLSDDPLLITLSKCLVLSLNQLIRPENIYESLRYGRKWCLEQMVKRFRNKKLILIGDDVRSIKELANHVCFNLKFRLNASISYSMMY